MSFTGESRRRTLPLFPLTSMIDVMFILLIFFMTTSVFRDYDQQIDVSLPATQSGHASASPRQVVITVTEQDEIFMSGQRYTLEELRAALARLVAELSQQTAVVRADAGSRWEMGVKVIDAAYAAGMKDVVVSTVKESGGGK